MGLKEVIMRRVAIHCPKEIQANSLLGYLDSFGYQWSTCKSLLSDTLWSRYREDTCYLITGGGAVSSSYIEFFKERKYKIIEYEDLSLDFFVIKIPEQKSIDEIMEFFEL